MRPSLKTNGLRFLKKRSTKHRRHDKKENRMARQIRSNSGTRVAGIVAALLAAAVPASGGTFYVDAASTAVIQDGTSWCSAWDDLQDALALIPSGAHVIHVAQGTYKPHATDRSVSFVLLDDVDIEGGYAGRNACVDPDTQDPDLYPTILSGDVGGVSSTDNSYHVITCASGVVSYLEGLTIRDGYANGSSRADKSGGGIRNGYHDSSTGANYQGGTLTLDDCKFVANHASDGGGGMTNVGHPAILSRCTFTGNDSDTGGVQYGGGGFYNRRYNTDNDTNSTFTDCVFDTNDSLYNGGAVWNGGLVDLEFTRCMFDDNSSNVDGGALYLDNASADVTGCDFTNNTSGSGGAIYGGNNYGQLVTVSSSTFTGNDAESTAAGSGGGGIWSGGNMALSGCTFDANTSQSNGGAVFANAAGPVRAFDACVFDENTAAKSGGAVFENSTSLAITYVNSLFVGNTSSGSGTDEGGGAILNAGSTNISYVNCTFVANKAIGGEGGGIRIRNDQDPDIINCIFWDNGDGSGGGTQDESAQIHLGNGGSNPTVTHCTIEGCADPGFCGDSDDANKAVAPNFVGTGAHPYQLTSSNNALIDNGDGENADNGCLSVNTTTADLTGEPNSRFIRKDGVCVTDAVIIDIGAYEVQSP
jgi:hypothetical protein